jgi:hypothetical protein
MNFPPVRPTISKTFLSRYLDQLFFHTPYNKLLLKIYKCMGLTQFIDSKTNAILNKRYFHYSHYELVGLTL